MRICNVQIIEQAGPPLASQQRPRAPPGSPQRNLLGEPRLADARLAREEQEPSLSHVSALERQERPGAQERAAYRACSIAGYGPPPSVHALAT
jgi:hypothetical protein